MQKQIKTWHKADGTTNIFPFFLDTYFKQICSQHLNKPYQCQTP